MPKNAFVLQQQTLFAFFLHALSACMLLHDCRSRVASLATSDQAVRRDASRFRFPARPTPAFLFATANPSICMAFLNISFLQVCIGSLVPPAGGVGCRPPATLRLLCYTWPYGALLATTDAMHHNPSFSVLRTLCSAGSCSSQAALPSQ